MINSLLDKYESEGIVSIETGSVLKVQPLNQLGGPVELVKAFGKKKDFEKENIKRNYFGKIGY